MCEKLAFVMHEKVRLFKVAIKILLLTCAMYKKMLRSLEGTKEFKSRPNL